MDRLQAAKSAIAAALQAMGVEPPEGTTLDQYAAQLTAIAASAPWLPLSGGEMTGDISSAKGHSIEFSDLSFLNLKGKAGVKVYANGTEKISFSSGNIGIKSNINMNDCSITNMKTPIATGDAANKGYVDGLVGSINSALDAINGEVV